MEWETKYNALVEDFEEYKIASEELADELESGLIAEHELLEKEKNNVIIEKNNAYLLEKSINDLEKIVKEQDQKYFNLENRVQECNNDLSIEHSKRVDVEKKLQSMETNSRILNQRVEDLTDALESVSLNEVVLEDEVEQMEGMIRALSAEHDHWKSQHMKLTASLQQVLEKGKNEETKVQHWKKKCNDLESMLSKVTEVNKQKISKYSHLIAKQFQSKESLDPFSKKVMVVFFKEQKRKKIMRKKANKIMNSFIRPLIAVDRKKQRRRAMQLKAVEAMRWGLQSHKRIDIHHIVNERFGRNKHWFLLKEYLSLAVKNCKKSGWWQFLKNNLKAAIKACKEAEGHKDQSVYNIKENLTDVKYLKKAVTQNIQNELPDNLHAKKKESTAYNLSGTWDLNLNESDSLKPLLEHLHVNRFTRNRFNAKRRIKISHSPQNHIIMKEMACNSLRSHLISEQCISLRKDDMDCFYRTNLFGFEVNSKSKELANKQQMNIENRFTNIEGCVIFDERKIIGPKKMRQVLTCTKNNLVSCVVESIYTNVENDKMREKRLLEANKNLNFQLVPSTLEKKVKRRSFSLRCLLCLPSQSKHDREIIAEDQKI